MSGPTQHRRPLDRGESANDDFVPDSQRSQSTDPTGPRPELSPIERDVALSLICRAGVGRLAWCENGWPHVEVVNFVLDGDRPVFRIGTSTKLFGVLNGALFALQVDHIDPVTRTGWTVA